MRSRLLATLFLAACTRTETVTRFVNLHVTGDDKTCRLSDGAGKYLATGDFEPLATNLAQQPLDVDVAGQTINGVPGNVMSLALLATPKSDPSVWLGATLVPSTGDVDMLVLPVAAACALTGTSVPFDAHMTFGAVSSHTMITTGTTSGHSFRMDLDTGRIAQMKFGIGQPRIRAAFASLGDGRAFVIGGVSGGAPQQSFEIFDEVNGDFESNAPKLVEVRSDHGAVALTNGNVLVAGGQNANNPILATELITFDGTQWRSNESSTLPLDVAHVDPFVLRLADGTVLVGGGTDGAGNGVGEVEFYSADGVSKLPKTPVPASDTHGFVALDGGGALFVDAKAAHHAYFVAPGLTYPIDNDITVPLTDVKLFAHDNGGALVWTGSVWWSFDPWSGCAPLPGAPTTGPGATSATAFGEPGMRAWIVPDGTGFASISVWRDSVRNEFATEGPYLVTDTLRISPNVQPPPAFANGALTLSPLQDAFVSDARYLDVAVQVDGAHVVIRAADREVDVGGASCPTSVPIQPSATLYVERHGATVSFAQGGPLIPCPAAIDPSARVAVGVRGDGAAKNLVVKRLGTALP